MIRVALKKGTRNLIFFQGGGKELARKMKISKKKRTRIGYTVPISGGMPDNGKNRQKITYKPID